MSKSDRQICEKIPSKLDSIFAGSGGNAKGGGDGDAPTIAKDTLVSKQFARVIDVISEGPIEGWAHPDFPLRDVYLDGTPIEAGDAWSVFHDGITSNGSKTFRNVSSVNFPFNAEHPNRSPMVGRYLVGTNIPPGTTVESVQSAHSLTMSRPATGSGSGQTWQLGGRMNFKQFGFQFRKGTQAQAPLQGFPAVEVTTQVNVALTRSGGPRSYVFADLTLDAVRFEIEVPQLQEQDLETGDVHGAAVEIRFLVNGSEVVRDTIRGVASSAYIRSYRINFANFPGTRTVTVERMTPDSHQQTLRNATVVWAYTVITEGKLRYPNTALVGWTMNAKQFGQVPVRAYHIKGVLCKIPSNYNPITRVYTGVWDGTFTTAWTNNPAWCWYKLATDKRFGLGNYLVEANVDKWSLYTIGKYCDEMVPNGKGGTEPRFTCNLYIQRHEDALKVLLDMAGIFRGMLCYNNGAVTPVQDAPTDPSAYRMFTPANVIDGVFNYSGTAQRARHNVAVVTWSDLSDAGKIKQEYVEDHDGITKSGAINQLDLTGFGCTSRAQARRVGLWAIYAEKILDGMVSYSTALEGYFVPPGKIVQIQDPFKAGADFSGRLQTGNTATHLFLDKTITLVGGHSYFVAVMNPSTNLLVVKAVTTGAGDWSDINCANFGFVPEDDSIWQISDIDVVEPALFRVLGVTPKEKNILEITALKYNESLYDFVDFDHPLEEPPTSNLPPAGGVEPPTNLETGTIQIIRPDHTIRQDLEVSWTASPDRYLARYRPTWRFNNGNWHGRHGQYDTDVASFRITNAQPGNYELAIYAVNTIGALSEPLEGEATVLPPPSNITGVGGLHVWGLPPVENGREIFDTRDCHFFWRGTSGTGPSSPFGPDMGLESGAPGTPDSLAVGFHVEIYNDDDKIWQDDTSASEYVFTWERNKQAVETFYGSGFGPLRIFRIEVRVKFNDGTLSDAARLTVENKLPPPPRNVSTIQGNGYIAWQWELPNAPDLDHFALYASIDPDDDEPDQVAEFHGTSGVYYPPDTQAWHYWLGTVDSFGNVSANVPQGPPPGGFVLPPTFTPPGGTYEAAVNVAITESTPGCTIRYALTNIGVNPTNFIVYGGPVNIASSKTLHAIATTDQPPFQSNQRSSDYIIAPSTVSTPVFSPAPGFYALGWPATRLMVTCASATSFCHLYWAFGRNPTTTDYDGYSPRNQTIFNLAEGTWDIRVIAVRSGWTNSSVASGVYRLVTSLGPPCPKPSYAPPAAPYPVFPMDVTISATEIASFQPDAPTIPSGLKLWLEADQITGVPNGGAVATWPDASGNGKDATQSSPSARPIFTEDALNGRPALRFNPSLSNMFMTTPSLGLSQPNTIIVVGKQTTTTTGGRFVDGVIGARQLLGLTITTGVFDSYAGTASVQGSKNRSAAFHILTMIYNGASSVGYLDGVQEVAGNPGSNGLGSIYIGNDGGGSVFLDGLIAAILVYDHALSESERLAVESYLATKYNLFGGGANDGQSPLDPLTMFSIKYTTDGQIPSRHGPGTTIASGDTVTLTEPCWLKAIAFARGREDSPVEIGNYRRAARLPTPTFSPGGGLYSTFPMNVDVRCSISGGVQMRYTLDGSQPSATNGTLIAGSSGTVSIPAAGTTLKAVAFGSGYLTSQVASALYNGVIVPPIVDPPDVFYDSGSTQNVTLDVAGGFDPNVPSTISGLQLWLKADALGLSDGADVVTWPDSSGNANDANAVTPKPIFKENVIGSMPGVLFDGVDDYLEVAASGGMQSGNYTIFAVIKTGATVAGSVIAEDYNWSGAADGNVRYEMGYYFHQTTADDKFGIGHFNSAGAGWLTAYKATNDGANEAHLYAGLYDGSKVLLYENGTEIASTSGTIATAGTRQFWIGRRHDDGIGGVAEPYFKGHILELIVFDNALSTTDRQAVESYLAAKYSGEFGVAVNARYTTDGTEPTRTNGTLVTSFPATIPISGGYRELRAIAFAVDPKSGYDDSEVKLSKYDWIQPPLASDY